MPETQVWKNYFDVVILAPPSVNDYVISLSREISRHGGKFKLGRRRFIPHISLYHIPVRPREFRSFVSIVRAIASGSKTGRLTLRKIDMPVVMTDKPEWLKKLHFKIVEQTSQVFDWDYGVESLWRMDYLPPHLHARARKYLKEYGSPLIGAAFRPHITLTSFHDKSTSDSVPVPPLTKMSFAVDNLTICELGPSHSCQRVVKRFPLNC
jgi:hypothetical protein